MSSDSAPGTPNTRSPRPRVRPITWAILAWVVIMIAAIIGAWQGSESRYGAVPELTVATGRDHARVLPFSATDLDGTTYTNPITRITVDDEQTLTVRLPVELQRTDLDVYEMRANGVREYRVDAGGPGQLLVPVVTDPEGRLEGLVVRAVPMVLAADGSESVLSGEWSVGLEYPAEN